jgi:uncharacterized protein YbgA (DUF1722 family)/uncharacterized protein YbbK (DUF523 family)
MGQEKIKVGVSSCLLGEEVRHDGGGKRQAFLTDVLVNYFDFIPTCPEVDIGLGVPRPTIHLIGDPKSPSLVFVRDHSNDITNKMQKYSQKRSRQLKGLSGYIFKKNSPTCGPDAKVYQTVPKPPKMGRGVFYKIFCEAHPLLPVEDEGRLNDPNLRSNFIERVFLLHKWQTAMEKGISAKKLVDFHSQHKLALMSHNLSAYKRLGGMIGNIDKKDLSGFADNYIQEMMSAFKYVATTKKVTNVLHHCMGYLKKNISTLDKQELLKMIEDYRLGRLPLIVPITLLKHHLMHYPNDYLCNQSFINPYPDELMLRNKI